MGSTHEDRKFTPTESTEQQGAHASHGTAPETPPEKVEKSPQQWRDELNPAQYHVCRERGTEPAFTGEYTYTNVDGVYRCVCCGNELFDSNAKFDSGCGWPSFWEVADKTRIVMKRDTSHGMERTEVCCARCDAHLGHVFNDGPAPTELRYCINSVSLDLEKRE